jgi:hypothetical protein
MHLAHVIHIMHCTDHKPCIITVKYQTMPEVASLQLNVLLRPLDSQAAVHCATAPMNAHTLRRSHGCDEGMTHPAVRTQHN